MTLPSTFKTFLFLTTSAAALGVLIHFEATPARAAASSPSPSVSPSVSASASASNEVRVRPRPTAPSRAVATPDLIGKRLVAQRTARKLGLVVIAHDEEGLRVDGQQAPYYRVRRQATAAGAGIEPGATVEVRVREIDPPSGY